MDPFDQLVEFTKQNYPAYAYVITPKTEIAVDGLIFRPNPVGGFICSGEAGQVELMLAEAIDLLRADMAI